MVIGFVMMALVLEAIGSFFFTGFMDAVRDAQQDSWTGLFSIVAYIFIFFTTSVMIVNVSVSLIHLVPDTVMSWIGSSTNMTQAGSQVTGNFTSAAAGVSAMGGSMAGGAVQGVKSSAREKKEEAFRSDDKNNPNSTNNTKARDGVQERIANALESGGGARVKSI